MQDSRYAEAFRPIDNQPNLLDEGNILRAAKEVDYLKAAALNAQHTAENVASINAANFYNDTEPGGPVYPNDAIGYQRRSVELERESASEEDLWLAKEARMHNVATDFSEKMMALVANITEPRAYRLEDGVVYDGAAYPVLEMFHNSLSALNNPLEQKRRISEASNFATIQAAGSQEGITDKAFIEISMCNHEKGSSGYVTSVDKMQIRYSRYIDDPETGERHLVMQPIYIHGLSMNDERMNRFLSTVSGASGDLGREDVLDRLLMADADKFNGPIDFVSLMDEFIASEEGQPVFMGEFGAGDYATFQEVAERRREGFDEAVTIIDEHLMELAEQDVTPVEAELALEDLQKKLALIICRENPELAGFAFDAKTEQTLRDVADLMNDNDIGAADRLFERAVQEAPDMVGCGASCGIRDANAKEANDAKNRGLRELSDGTLKQDKVRACPGCGLVGGLTYGTDKNGNIAAYCQGCGKTNGGKKKKSDEEQAKDAKKPEVKTFLSFSEVEKRYKEKKTEE